MDAIELVFEDEDLTIKKETLEALGLKKGDKVQIGIVERTRKKPVLEPANFSEEEQARRQAILDRLWGLWSEEDEKAFLEMREEMNKSWQPRSF